MKITIPGKTPMERLANLTKRVVAVPTYMLDDRVVSLANPYPEELFARFVRGHRVRVGSLTT